MQSKEEQEKIEVVAAIGDDDLHHLLGAMIITGLSLGIIGLVIPNLSNVFRLSPIDQLDNIANSVGKMTPEIPYDFSTYKNDRYVVYSAESLQYYWWSYLALIPGMITYGISSYISARRRNREETIEETRALLAPETAGITHITVQDILAREEALSISKEALPKIYRNPWTWALHHFYDADIDDTHDILAIPESARSLYFSSIAHIHWGLLHGALSFILAYATAWTLVYPKAAHQHYVEIGFNVKDGHKQAPYQYQTYLFSDTYANKKAFFLLLTSLPVCILGSSLSYYIRKKHAVNYLLNKQAEKNKENEEFLTTVKAVPYVTHYFIRTIQENTNHNLIRKIQKSKLGFFSNNLEPMVSQQVCAYYANWDDDSIKNIENYFRSKCTSYEQYYDRDEKLETSEDNTMEVVVHSL